MLNTTLLAMDHYPIPDGFEQALDDWGIPFTVIFTIEAIRVNDGKVTIASSTFEGWKAENGGAIHVVKTSEPMTIKSTKFIDNNAVVCLSEF